MKKEKILFSKDVITKRVSQLGKALEDDYRDKKPIVIPLLRGGFIFASDLVRDMDIDLEIDFLTTTSYGNEEKSSGTVKILSDIRSDIFDRDVIIVDDIMDSGRTMKEIKEYLKSKSPKSIKTCVMLDKPSRREVDIEPDYTGFVIEDVFIVGYGLNYGDFKRNVPYIYTYIEE